MKRIEVLIATVLAVLMLVALHPMSQVEAPPRTGLDVVWYVSQASAFYALQQGDVDMIQGELTTEQKYAVEADPNLQIAACSSRSMSQFDMGNFYGRKDYPGATNPCYFAMVRKAIAHMIDKNYIISNIFENFGNRIDAPVSYSQTADWADPSVVTFDFNGNGVIDPSEDNYPYKYSITAAVDLLAGMGFSDTNADGYLEYPNDPVAWGAAAGISTTMMPLKTCIRNDDTNLLAAGRYLYTQLEGNPAVAGDSVLATSPEWAVNGKIGGDFDTTDETWVKDSVTLRQIVNGEHNYTIYTGSWTLGEIPTLQYNMFHSQFWHPYGSNYVTDNAHPAYDTLLENLYYAANIDDAKNASREATKYHINDCVTIPFVTPTCYVAWRKEAVGVVNMRGSCILNCWTFLNAWRAKTTNPLRVGAVRSWQTLNILYSWQECEYLMLDRIYPHLITTSPYDLSSHIPWLAQDWEVGTWTDPRDGVEKTTVTYWFRKDIGCAAPVTGAYSGRFNATDYIFSCWYNYAYDDSAHWSNFMDINHIQKLGDYSVKVYFDDVSSEFAYTPIYPMLGPTNILNPLLCTAGSASFTGADLVESPPGYKEYAFTADKVVLVKYATVNGANMTEGVDYYIRAGYDVYTHNVFVPLKSFAPTDAIVIKYYYATPDGAGGTYLGGNLGLDWTDTMYSYGCFYPISISTTVAALNKNPYFFLETVPKGEINFRWYWVAGPKPRSGNFKIDILDVVMCTGSYCTRGDLAYNSRYLPGADIDDNDLCHIGIFDLVTVTGKYVTTFGQPPP